MSPTAETTDDVFRLHAGGKLEIRHRVPLETRADLERVYTPGFTHVAKAISRNPEDVYRWSINIPVLHDDQHATAVAAAAALINAARFVGKDIRQLFVRRRRPASPGFEQRRTASLANKKGNGDESSSQHGHSAS